MAASTDRTAHQAEPVVVGRDAELRRARALVHGSAGAAWAVLGEGGIGKTTLLDRCAALADDADVPVLRAGADPELARPFALLAEALGSVPSSRWTEMALLEAADRWSRSGDEATADGTLGAIPLLVDAALDALEKATATGPVLLLLDDLQWADPLSLRVLVPTIRRALPLGVRIAIGARHLPHRPELDRVLDAVRRAHGAVEALPPLDEASAIALAERCVPRSLADRAEDLARRTGGNPFLIVELARSQRPGDDLVPDELVALVRQRASSAGDGVEELVRAIAVLGPGLGTAHLSTVLDEPEPRVRSMIVDAVAGGLLIEGDGDLRLRHDLLRDALLAATPASVVRSLHRRAVEALEGTASSPIQLAHHLLCGAETVRTDEVARLRDLLALEPPVATADLLVESLARCPVGLADRPDLAGDAADALLYAGRPTEAAELAANESPRSDPRARARLRAIRSHALFALGQPDAATATWAAEADADDAIDGEPVDRGLELAELALARLFAGSTAAARADAEAALQLSGVALARSTAHGVLGWIDGTTGDLDAAMAHVDAAVAGAPPEDRSLRYGPHLMRAAVADAAGERQAFDESMAALRLQVERHGMAVLEPMMWSVQAVADLRAGCWDDALAATQAGWSAVEDAGIRLACNWLAAVEALVLVDRGQVAEAAEVLEANVEPTVLPGLDWVTLARARIQWARGDERGAFDALRPIVELFTTAGAHSCLGHVGADLARLATACDDRSAIGWLAEALRSTSARNVGPLAASTDVAIALLEDDPMRSCAAAHRLLDLGRRPDAARAYGDAAAMLAPNDPDRARECARLSTTLFDELSAAVPADQLRARLRAAGIRTRPKATPARATTGWEALTSTEQRIAVLVCEGLTNQEIAQRLVVSRRTVESHLLRAYRKLSVRSRLELARVATEHGRAPTSEA